MMEVPQSASHLHRYAAGWDLHREATEHRHSGDIVTQTCNAIISAPVENDDAPHREEQGVALTDNCCAGQWPLRQLVHNTCHHVLSAQHSAAA